MRRISLLHYAPALLLLLIVAADSGQYPDPDLWGHLRFGQAALASGHVVTVDTYSYSAANAAWRNHEWLTELVMAIAYNAFGVVGLKLWKFACVAATMVLMALAMAETGASPTIQLNLLAVAALAMIPQNQFRPQLFTFMLLAATLALLARHNYRGRAHLWIVIPIMALWGNLHGGFIIGIATLAVYSGVVGLQDLIAGRGLERGLWLGGLTVAGTLATLISPYGIDNWLVVINALKVHAAHPIIADWQPLLHALIEQVRAYPQTVIFFVGGIAIMASFVVTVVRSPHGDDLPLVTIAAMMTVGVFAAVRNLPLAIIACMAPLARHTEMIVARRRSRDYSEDAVVTVGKPRHGASAETLDRSERSAVNPWLAVSIAVAMAIIAGLFSPRLAIDVHEYPVGAVAFMRSHGLRGNILDEFGWGEYLIWHLEPGSKVFIDGRYDSVYSEAIVNQYLDLDLGHPDGLEVLRAHPNDLVLLSLNAPGVSLMKSAPGWKLVYHDAAAVLFARANSAAAQLPGVPVAGALPREAFFP
jgi:hypothetical protein